MRFRRAGNYLLGGFSISQFVDGKHKKLADDIKKCLYMRRMNIGQAKQIPLQDFLARLGYLPSRQNSSQAWFLSPFRGEDTPSFKINKSMNAWYDFGLGMGGDIIDFVIRLEQLTSTSAALTFIGKVSGSAPEPIRPQKVVAIVENTQALQLTSAGPVRSKSLKSYLSERGIELARVADCVQEVHYRHGKGSYFALALANNSGGYELRSPMFKGTLGAKDISLVAGDPHHVQVFEGLFDYLTSRMLATHGPKPTAIILNSVSMREKAITAIEQLAPTTVEVFRDHDQAGEELIEFFRQSLPSSMVIDKAELYQGFDDLNAWFTAQSNQVRRMG